MADSITQAREGVPARPSAWRPVAKAWLSASLGALPLLAILFTWWLAVKAEWYSAVLLPAPGDVLKVFFTQPQELGKHLLASTTRVGSGIGLAVITAIPLGLLIGYSPRLERLFDWTIQIFRSFPPIALIPLAILFFGIGDKPAIILIWVAAFWPLLINTIFGVKSTEQTLMKVARAARASHLMLLRDVLLPSAMPYILTGLRLAVAAGWLTVVVAEMIAVRSGLGYLINYAQTVFRPDLVMAGILIIGMVGLLLDQLLRLVRSRLCRWQDGLVLQS